MVPAGLHAHDIRLLPPSGASPTLPGSHISKGEQGMKNPLDSLWGTVIAGLILTVILYYVVKSLIGG